MLLWKKDNFKFMSEFLKENKMYEFDAYDLYNKYLDDLGLENLNLPPASRVLEKIDPAAYYCGFIDFCDNEGIDVGSD